ncbi:serine protease [Pseudoxanthomonas sp. GW2]|uniref:S1 family peptidase n=1 Tax=Pseudoxanthomonas sp. GW2 TaxID=1211114 RepID=UPI0009FE375C|nr:serine protease [Pseudoxanthomonas sp. GW2]MCR6663790.1 serine protease [Luteimonas sp.]
MHVDDAIHGISTLIQVQTATGGSQGTGFFYQQLSPRDPSKDGQWRKVEDAWLITNRHVLLPQSSAGESIPTSLTFHLRKMVDGSIVWEPITLDQSSLISRARLHANPDVDVCAIRVLDLISDRIKSGETYLNWYGVSSDNLAGNNKINPHVASDAVVVGYPRGFYDHVNVFPIVKSGIIASRWGANFQGQPYFLIDAKLFPGSSGSIVISKPTDLVVEDGKFFHAKEKQFAFLGIFSGEPYQSHSPIEFDDLTIIRKSGFNVGIVWYGHLVDEILTSGVSLSET